MSFKIWIIALNQQNPVAQELKATLEAEHFDVDITAAVDGRTSMPELENGEKLSQSRSLIHRRAKLTSSEVGCYLSHYRLIKKAYNAGFEHVGLFEDDVVAEPGLGDAIRSILTLGEEAHLVRLMSLKIRKRKIVQPLNEPFQLVRPVRGALGTQGYILNREGMKRIIKAASTIYMPIDSFYDSFFVYNFNCFTIEPHAIYELEGPSNIKKTEDGINKSLGITVAWRFYKLFRSIMRKWHRLIHPGEFSPAGLPEAKPGRSVRLR
ncbi:MAG: glycosyltransferase family 25 protein [Pseudomonadales bacterium]|nr:glycosyltransferase family 25 protein [Pseudomonadales bacterium]